MQTLGSFTRSRSNADKEIKDNINKEQVVVAPEQKQTKNQQHNTIGKQIRDSQDFNIEYHRTLQQIVISNKGDNFEMILS